MVIFSFQLDSLYRRSRLAPWYERVEIDGFNPGSVLVDYILHLTEIADTLDTTDLKKILNQEMEEEEDSFVLGNYTLDPKGTDFLGKANGVVGEDVWCCSSIQGKQCYKYNINILVARSPLPFWMPNVYLLFRTM